MDSRGDFAIEIAGLFLILTITFIITWSKNYGYKEAGKHTMAR